MSYDENRMSDLIDGGLHKRNEKEMSNASKGIFKGVFTLGLARAVRNEGGIVCFLPKPFHYPNQDQRFEEEMNEAKENQELICEAFTVHNETGKTPRDLQASNKELVEALRESNLQIEYLQRKFQYTGSGNSVISRNESIIAKHTKG